MLTEKLANDIAQAALNKLSFIKQAGGLNDMGKAMSTIEGAQGATAYTPPVRNLAQNAAAAAAGMPAFSGNATSQGHNRDGGKADMGHMPSRNALTTQQQAVGKALGTKEPPAVGSYGSNMHSRAMDSYQPAPANRVIGDSKAYADNLIHPGGNVRGPSRYRTLRNDTSTLTAKSMNNSNFPPAK